MDKKKYQKIVDKHKATESRGLNLLIAFVVGGIVGALGQFLIEFYSYYLNISTKDASVFMIVTLIFFATLFTALGFFDKWVTFAKCGLIIPITGFAHSMASAGIEYKKDGPIYGLGSNLFKLSGSVILYGIVSAWAFGLIRYLLLGGA
ncbi:MAG: SpoVA/SpoVAEb family sporulation membrane protein [Bacilli bacterium]|nr:SpoVA/SpoVAEb family sporulation membrane protein [Clostridium sp.]MDY6015890.1 SpoVA/SpoVAEb family sporulation membrane protein [Bacilli bacterium]